MIQENPVTIAGTTCFNVDSKHVNDQFEIRVFQPLPLPPAHIDMGLQLPDAFRVVYTLDANMTFATLAEAAGLLAVDPDGLVEHLTVVGIGYPLDDHNTSKVGVLRSRDMTPPGTPEPPEMEMIRQGAGGLNAGFGQADRFLRFLEDELDPLIRREFPCLPGRAGLFGFSYGGLFALYALFSRSQMFDRYIIGSPGSVVEGDLILEYEERCWAEGPELNAGAFITLGSIERTSALTGIQLLAANYDKLIARLEERGYKGLEWSSHVFENESHVSSWPLAFSHGLRRLFPSQSSPLVGDIRSKP